MRKFKKILKLSIIIVFILCLFVIVGDKSNITNFNPIEVSNVFKDDDYTSKYIYVLNREDKNAEYKKNHNSKAYPASLTKIMTSIVALEHINDLSATAPVDVETYKKMVENNASMAGFYGNEAVTYRDLLYGTMLSSGGEAANSLAINISGSVDEFVNLMNNKASEIGLKNTRFTNPEGLHDKNQYTTAYDMAKLLDYALNNGDFRAIFTKKTFKTTSTLDHPDGINLRSTVLSKLEGVSQEGFEIIGGKSGTTYEAGECWATFSIKNGREYICIVMGAPLEDINNPDMAQMYDSIKLYSRID
ncbi:D-alanyl-D-alanine carboxypeptidase family protein [Gottschalkia acidurici]|nr:serine hydrolase [Gottschalkia acidurici]